MVCNVSRALWWRQEPALRVRFAAGSREIMTRGRIIFATATLKATTRFASATTTVQARLFWRRARARGGGVGAPSATIVSSPYKTRQGKARYSCVRDKECPDKVQTQKTNNNNTNGQTRPDQTRQDKTRQDKTRQDRTGRDKTGQDKTRQDKIR
jgi:hypothetical protein